ncbi:MAG: hypothetical protein NUV97_02805, partial [archaeon]|nr:hypothetical protein [archaeon]
SPEQNDETGAVTIKGGVSGSIPIEVVEMKDSTFYNAEEIPAPVVVEKEGSNTLTWIIVAVVLVILYLAFRGKKKK